MYAFSSSVNTGSLRETFFLDQAGAVASVQLPEKGDFLLDGKYLFEVGGAGKTFSQISGVKDSYLAIDDVETGYGAAIPLWMFGFLYWNATKFSSSRKMRRHRRMGFVLS